MSEIAPKIVPQCIEPRKFAVQHVTLKGTVECSALTRLAEVVEVLVVDVDLAFAVDEEHRRTVTGSISAEVNVTCQRCLNPMGRKLTAEANWAVVWNEEKAKQLPGRYEPWIAGEDSADLYAMVEDELLLVLPAAPMHEELCIDESLLSVGEQPSEAEEPKDNPFKVLMQLKGQSKN